MRAAQRVRFRGEREPADRRLQVALRAWGYYNGPVDGIAGPMTAGGLHAFQRRVGLPTGVADVRTRVKLGPLGTPLFGSRLLERGCFGWDVSVSSSCFGARTSTTARSTGTSTPRRARTAPVPAARTSRCRWDRRSCDALRDRYACTRSGAPEDRARVAQYFYVVRAGDSLTAIARRFGTSVGALARANHLDSSHYLLIGKRLQVPHSAPTDVRALLDKWATRFGVDPNLVRALAWMESGYQTKLVSSAGTRGVMQLLPTTRQYVSDVVLRKPIPAGVDGDVEAGVALIKHLLGAFRGNQKLALAAWYQGERAVRTNGVYKVTKPFVADVLALRARM